MYIYIVITYRTKNICNLAKIAVLELTSGFQILNIFFQLMNIVQLNFCLLCIYFILICSIEIIICYWI